MLKNLQTKIQEKIDNENDESVNDTIKISTIRQPIELIAEKAVNSLIDIINNKNTEKEIILPITYINGSTTKR